MSNSFGSLYVGASGIKSSSNALNTTANNLANVSTTGYVREQVLFSDKNYITTGTASISKQQSGLGVSIGDVIHARDIFLDKSYRTAIGRKAFYENAYNTTSEVETYFQEMEGQEFATTLSDFSTALNSYSGDPSSGTNQNLVVQKASTLIKKAQTIYSQLKTYQSNVNTQISDAVDTVNSLATKISDLNKQIQKVESGGVETAMDLRDTRDSALDQLAKYGNITYSEGSTGIVEVSFEGHQLVLKDGTNTMAKSADSVTGFVTPYWADTSTPSYTDKVYDLTKTISSENDSDVGTIKSLLLSRGETYGTYKDLLYNASGGTLTKSEYTSTLGSSTLENTEAEFDQMIHNIMTTVNDVLCPNSSATVSGSAVTFSDANGTALYSGTVNGSGNYELTGVYDSAGNPITLAAGSKILDSNTASTGKDGKLPPQELFTRNGMNRYTSVTTYNSSGTATGTIYVYNAEDVTNSSSLYTVSNSTINSELVSDKTKLPYLTQNGSVNYALGSSLTSAWSAAKWTLNPTNTTEYSFADYYTNMIAEIATQGSTYATASDTMSTSVTSISNQRDEVIGVSTDEELTNMIKYQNAYNAASRYVNVITTMIDSLLSMVSS